MNKLIILSLFLILSFSVQANSSLNIEPLYGIERTQRMYPKPAKYTTKTFIGVRGTYGTAALAGELELSQSNGSDDFPDTNEKVEYTTQRAMLGIRSYPIRNQYFGAFFRAGARAQVNKRKIVKPSETINKEDPLTFDPYAGTGVTLAFANNFALSAGATLMYNRNAPSSEQYDTQYTFSFTIKAGNR